MTTHRVPQPGRFGSRMERPLLIILLILLVVVAALLAREVWNYTIVSPVPTRMPEATLPVTAAEPAAQITPVVGSPGTRITVQGQGWRPGDQLIVCLDDLGSDAAPLVYAQVTADDAGEFVTSFTFPAHVQWRSLPDVGVVVESMAYRDKASAVFRLLPDTPTLLPSPIASLPPTTTPTPTAVPFTPTPACTYGVGFVADVTIPDDTVVPAGVGFVKTWRIRNTGTCVWRAGTSWVFAGGNQMGGPVAVAVPVTNPGETADVSVHLVAPMTPGTYTGYWTLRTDQGVTIGQQYFVRIVVPAPTATRPPATPTSTATSVIPTATPIPATPTPVIINWRGEYFNNPTLTGTPMLVRDDAAVNFNWGSGAPAAGLPADNFSVRWTRSLYFDGGAYRFYVRSDDGVRLWLDNNLILNQWHDASDTTYTAEVSLGTGNHLIRVEYYEALGTAQIQFWWQRADVYPDWRGEYWANRSLSGPPALVRNDTAVNFNWGGGAPAIGLPADSFSARWTRTLTLAEGNYRFHAMMDDGLRLYVNNTLVIDEWRDASQREVSADIWLTAGNYELRVEYYENLGDALVRVWWESVAGFPDWRGDYWANKNLAGAPTLTRNDREINFNWGFGAPAPGLPDEEFSVRWTRVIEFTPGVYRFSARADDGVRVFVDGNLLIDQWHSGGADRTYQEEITLSGTHTLVVEYYEDHFGAQIHFWYERLKALAQAE